jgi:hypothetical protein
MQNSIDKYKLEFKRRKLTFQDGSTRIAAECFSYAEPELFFISEVINDLNSHYGVNDFAGFIVDVKEVIAETRTNYGLGGDLTAVNIGKDFTECWDMHRDSSVGGPNLTIPTADFLSVLELWKAFLEQK